MNPLSVTRKDGTLIFPGAYWFIQRLRASLVNRRWVTREEFEEIRRGN